MRVSMLCIAAIRNGFYDALFVAWQLLPSRLQRRAHLRVGPRKMLRQMMTMTKRRVRTRYGAPHCHITATLF
jgi:hypothetical protein